MEWKLPVARQLFNLHFLQSRKKSGRQIPAFERNVAHRFAARGWIADGSSAHFTVTDSG
jgi:hypothetical protein